MEGLYQHAPKGSICFATDFWVFVLSGGTASAQLARAQLREMEISRPIP